LRGMERAATVFERHWDCLAARGFWHNLERCPIRPEQIGAGVVAPPYCWEPVPSTIKAYWMQHQREMGRRP
jgi:hypothetical protein